MAVPELGRPERPASLYSFGPFELDEGARRLTRDGEPVALSDRQIEIMLALVANAGRVMPKDVLIDVAWPDVAVGDQSSTGIRARRRRPRTVCQLLTRGRQTPRNGHWRSRCGRP